MVALEDVLNDGGHEIANGGRLFFDDGLHELADACTPDRCWDVSKSRVTM
jgi:hypothetical protein